MEARFGKILIRQVDKALAEEPSREGLQSLLQIVDPSFTEEDLSVAGKRASTLRSLNLLIHPDKHPGDPKATKRFQDTRAFYDKCMLSLTAKRRKCTQYGSPRSSALPLQFHVQDKWRCLARPPIEPLPPWPSNKINAKVVELVLAYRCINYRGAVAHGKRTELAYDNRYCNTGQSASQLFIAKGGCKTLSSTEEIKEELMHNGPVVSTSFHLTGGFVNAGDHAHLFEGSLVGQTHSILIVGWKQTAFGEMWLVRSTRGATDVPIATGQFSLEDNVIAPKNDFSDTPWQHPSKSFDIERLPGDWYSWTSIDTHCSSGKLEALFDVVGCAWSKALSSKTPFVVREAEKKSPKPLRIPD